MRGKILLKQWHSALMIYTSSPLASPSQFFQVYVFNCSTHVFPTGTKLLLMPTEPQFFY